MILVQGIVFFALYYFIFRFVIKIFNLNTIGRGDNLLADPTVNTTEKDGAETTSKSKYHHTASQILEGLGGSENITTLTNCATRLRMELKDNSIIDEQKLEMQERRRNQKWSTLSTSYNWHSCTASRR